MATRLELLADDPEFLLWIGEENKDWYNYGSFSIGNTGNAWFNGTLSAGVTSVSRTNPMFKNNSTIVIPGFGTAGSKKVLVCSILYANIGFNATAINGAIQAGITLGRSTDGVNYTNLSGWTVDGTVTSNPVSGGYQVEYRLAGSFTFTDNDPVAAPYYRASLSGSGLTWPALLDGEYGTQRLTIVGVQE